MGKNNLKINYLVASILYWLSLFIELVCVFFTFTSKGAERGFWIFLTIVIMALSLVVLVICNQYIIMQRLENGE